MDGQVLNKAMLDESSGGDQEFATELFTDLIVRAAEIEAVVARAIAVGDADALRRAAHELKGSCLTLGAERVAGACRHLEEQGRSQNLADSAPWAATLHEELSRLLETLQAEGLHA